ncbi:MAG: heme ABC exporter ATP-binding protein CcmA [Candidatus Puniceispirillaceae bacterium]
MRATLPDTTPDPAAAPAGLRLSDVVLLRGGRLVQPALSLRIGPGEVVLLRGPNGSGKSTLLRTIAGRLPAPAGRIECDVPILYIGHADGLSPALSGRRNLGDWARLNGLAGDDAAIDAALDRMQARPFAELPVRRLSHGQRRRVALARLTLGQAHALWLLDEPNAGLDAASSIALDDLISGHLEGGGMVLAATHLPLGVTHKPRTLTLEVPT